VTTAEKIENFTDAGKFENLIHSILRFIKPEYASIISTGVNIYGKPIKSPLDGFSLIPNSKPPKFVMVQHTTAKLKDLEDKWLFDHTTASGKRKTEGYDGDVIKSGQFAQKIRKGIPDAEFILVLSTNRRLSLSGQIKDPLILKTYKKCQEHNIECDIWEQSRIVHFLDNTSNGHYLRKEYLGIEAELLSEKLLEKICKTNLERYKEEFFLDNDNFHKRKVDLIVDQKISNQKKVLHLLIGESGFGKSTISYNYLKKHFENGGFGLWIPVEDLEDVVPLENIIGKMLKKMHPSLNIDTEDLIWKFTGKKKFIVVIDDLNRASDPTKIIRKIISFLPPSLNEDNKQFIDVPFRILCPLWPKIWTPISKKFKNNPKINQIDIDKFSIEEAETIILAILQRKDYQITRLQANQLAKQLGCDPFLIKLFSNSLKSDDPQQTTRLTNDTIGEFIQEKIDESVEKSSSAFLNLEYNEVLLKICDKMLVQKQFFPTFDQIEEWLSENTKYIGIFRELAQHRILCFINKDKKLVFRHDRIQFYLLIQSMLKILESNNEIRSKVISEPYYAEILGQSILFKEQSDTQLNELQEKNILSLFEALKLICEPRTEYHNKIIEKITVWVKEDKKKEYTLSSIIDAISWIIIETDSNAIIQITNYLPQNQIVQFARIRNGCVNSGIDFCSDFNHFQPGLTFSLRDRIFEHAKEKHSEKIQTELKEILQSDKTSDKERYGALIFTGFLKFSTLQKEILICWNKTENKNLILPAALWAGINCCNNNFEQILDPIIGYWASLSDDDDPESGELSEKLEISEELQMAIRITRKMSNQIVKYLILQSEKHNSLTWPILIILHAVDDPDAVEFVVSKVALNFSGSFFSLSISDRWNPNIFTYANLLSSQSFDRLETLWINDKVNPEIRKNAFKLWQTGANIKDTEKLQNISSESILFRESVILRVKLRDLSVLPDYLPLISQKSHYLYVAHHIWCKEIQYVVETYLESFKENISKDFNGDRLNEHYALSGLLMTLPKQDAEKLLEKYWGYLKFSSLFIHSALYIGTPLCLKLAEEAVNKCPEEIDIFSHISLHFWKNDNGRPRILTIKRLNNLKPYLYRFSEGEILHLFRTCESCGFIEWGRENLITYLSEENKKRILISDEDILQELQRTELKDYLGFFIENWIEKNKCNKNAKDQLFRIIHRLLSDDPSQENLEITSIILKIIGNRTDLEILENFRFKGDNQKILNIKKDTQFYVFRRTIQ